MRKINLNKILKKSENNLQDIIQYGVNEVRNEILLSIQQTPKTGKSYNRGKKTHIASEEGNPPAVDTGRLWNSIETVYKNSVFTGEVSANTNYAVHLEFGTSKMKARPFMQPALEKKRKKILERAKNIYFKF